MKQPEGGGGGGAKDFFADRDAEFIRHKQRLLKQVDTIRASLAGADASAVGYVKVRLQSTALAKSHRPMDAIFKPQSLPLVGTGALGELYFEVTAASLNKVASTISGAEDKVTKRDSHDRLKVSAARSEAGAIEDITLPTSRDKRAFELQEALQHFQQCPGARYFAVELFVDEATLAQEERERSEAHKALRQFRRGLRALSPEITIWSSNEEWQELHLTVVQFPMATVHSHKFEQLLEKAIAFLDHSPLVRQYALGASVGRSTQSTQAVRASSRGKATLPQPQAGQSYPIVGVVDAGVSRHRTIAAWSVGTTDYMREPDSERDHGTFIAGLLVNGAVFNPGQPIEPDACKYFDFDLFSEDQSKFEDNFEKGFIDMLLQLDAELSQFKPDGLRVINLSLNPEEMTNQSGYSAYAALLDLIADKHDVIFVISAGNLQGAQVRNRWPDEATPALQQLASYRQLGADRIYVPGETARNLTVGALEPLDPLGRTRPARYSRRGPATSAGIKPDFAHVGGCTASSAPLISVDHLGAAMVDEGTSFASPLVAKSLALLDHRIEGHQPRELLMALMYHFAQMPKLLDHTLLTGVSKDFAGFGLPAAVDDMLATDDDTITLVFKDTLPPGRELSFDFVWPDVLIENGRTRGQVELTVVYSPPLDRLHHAEFARVNIDAYLRQEMVNDAGEVSYHGRLKADHSGKMEKNLIAHGAKWWPVKHYSKPFKRLSGTSHWRLVVDSLTRAGASFPQEGVPFAVVLTISDPDKKAAVFQSARRALLQQGVNLVDVRTAVRARTK
jgi:hypothetical protein